MPKSIAAQKREQRYLASLEESATKAERMEKYFANHPELDPENEAHMDRAQKNYRIAHPESEETVAKGYVDEQESRSYAYTSHEAATLISEKAKAIMKAKKCSYLEAVNQFYDDPKNQPIIVAYAQAD